MPALKKMKRAVRIFPSILSADFSHLQDEIDRISNADGMQIDVMDGHFVGNLTFGPLIMEKIKTKLKKDVHLMVENPKLFIKPFHKVGADIITFHIEAVADEQEALSLLHEIRSFGIRAGVAINPPTPISSIEGILAHLDQVIVMTVNPGWGEQKFIAGCLNKVKELRKNFDGDIQVDGGVNDKNIADCTNAGADIAVAGSFVFHSKNPAKQVEILRKASFLSK